MLSDQSLHYGRIEVIENEEIIWTVCNDGNANEVVSLMCKHMGYNDGISDW